MTAEEARQLERIEARLAHIEATMNRVEQAIAVFLAGPGRKLMRLFGGKVDA